MMCVPSPAPTSSACSFAMRSPHPAAGTLRPTATPNSSKKPNGQKPFSLSDSADPTTSSPATSKSSKTHSNAPPSNSQSSVTAQKATPATPSPMSSHSSAAAHGTSKTRSSPPSTVAAIPTPTPPWLAPSSVQPSAPKNSLDNSSNASKKS